MKAHRDARAIAAARQETERAQADAADPDASAWVNANAGTGKTHVLTLRVLRLLLAGTPPERILCLTYTKAAAAEMSKRVFDRLAGWVTTDDGALKKELENVLGRKPDIAETLRARTLFTRAIETPGGLKVQTIHAFAERLLQRFPLEAGVAPGFKILDDAKGRELLARAIEGTLKQATASPDSLLGRALRTAVRYAADQSFDDLLSRTVAERAWLEAASRVRLDANADDFAEAEALLRHLLGVPANATRDALDAQRAEVLKQSDLQALRDHLASGGATDLKFARLIADAIGQAALSRRVAALSEYFLVDRGKSTEKHRGSLMSKALQESRADLNALAATAQARFFALTGTLQALTLVEAGASLYRLAGDVLQRYTDAKRAAGALDFEDLIEKTKSLLRGDGSADWVLYKLDGGLDHVLVDEAQDTSPAQWDIITALAREFFAGHGARDVARTIFAVGDEKQSIYSFQGARPEMFAATGRAFRDLALGAGATWRQVPLKMSFRTVQPVLDAVDSVFADPVSTPGLTASKEKIEHIASRFGQAGLIEVWPTETHGESSAVDPWDPLADTSERAPANRLAERIASTIARWIEAKERLRSEDRPIRAGDVLILVRKRNPFAVPMVAALKKRGIPVAGSDRIRLTDQIAVKDLMALGDFLTLPEDDLALAVVLKGPLFNLDDDDLLRIARGRKGALWKAVLAHARDDAKFQPAADMLKRWRAKADFTPPYEFFAGVLDREGGRTRMLERLGPEAVDALDEFLDLALSYDDGAPPSLTGFLAHVRFAKHEVKRDMEHDRDEVRVMTVHGAKGLEAPIVFLPDTCTTASGEGPATRLLALGGASRPTGLPDPVIWQVKGTSRVPAVANARADKAARETEERNRLLYVAMTRARDRLYVGGFERKTGRETGCWYDQISSALAPHMTHATLPSGETVLRLESKQTEETEPAREAAMAGAAAVERPPFALQRAAAEPRLSVPLQPSRLEPYAPDAEGEPLMPPGDPALARDVPSPLAAGSDVRFLRGNLTHALLQHLPDVARERRKTVATAFIERRGAALTKRARANIVQETLAVLSHPDFAPLFSTESRAEVPISAIIPRPGGRGPALELSGQIDRLAVANDQVLVIDYKTNRPPPSDLARVADAYLFQLAAYALALGEIYPNRRVRCALLWTDGPRLMEIPEATLKDYGQRLWELEVARLDAP